MIAAATDQFELDMPVDGVSERDTAEKIIWQISERQRLGIARRGDTELLAESRARLAQRQAIPAVTAYIWSWFLDLHSERESSGYGPQPLTSEKILAWSVLSRQRPTPWEVRMIRRLDGAWCGVWAEARKMEEMFRKRAASEAASAAREPGVIGRR